MYLLDYLQEKHGFEGITLVLAEAAPGPSWRTNQVGEEELMPFPRARRLLLSLRRREAAPRRGGAGRSAPMFPDVTADAAAGLRGRSSCGCSSQSIYKWVQAPLSLHIGNLDLDRERALQLPVVTDPSGR